MLWAASAPRECVAAPEVARWGKEYSKAAPLHVLVSLGHFWWPPSLIPYFIHPLAPQVGRRLGLARSRTQTAAMPTVVRRKESGAVSTAVSAFGGLLSEEQRFAQQCRRALEEGLMVQDQLLVRLCVGGGVPKRSSQGRTCC